MTTRRSFVETAAMGGEVVAMGLRAMGNATLPDDSRTLRWGIAPEREAEVLAA